MIAHSLLFFEGIEAQHNRAHSTTSFIKSSFPIVSTSYNILKSYSRRSKKRVGEYLGTFNECILEPIEYIRELLERENLYTSTVQAHLI